MAWCIKGSKKGELQVFVEKRPKGKKATCIDHVEGDAQSLLTELKDKLGCGGILAPSGAGSRVELQGDHVEAALLFLAERPDRLKGVAGAKKTIEAAAHALAAASAAEILVEEAAERRERRRTSGKARHAKDSWTVETPEAVRQGLMVKLADGGCDLLPWTAKHCCPMDWVYCSSNCRVPNDLGGYDPPANGNVFWDDGARVTLRDDAMDVSAFEDLLMCPSPANDAAEHSRGQQQKNALRRQAKAAVISKRRDISTTAKPTAPKSAPRTAPPPRAWSRPDVTVDDEYGDADDWDEDVSEESEDEDDASAPAGRPARPSRASSQLDADVRRKSMPTVDWATMYSALADAACGAAASSVDWTIADAVLYAGGDLDEAALEAVRAHIEREAHREEKRYDDGVACAPRPPLEDR
mmetsp:Transcript_26399/g.91086  ORF Transcript_26399/g.91086 Transcript_26399/m.91086 type:complete len:411 (-) Transcript_26399:132-1364(-)